MTELLLKIKRQAPLLTLAIAIIVFPLLVNNPYYLNVVNVVGLNTIIVVGLNLLIGYAGQISLGHAAFYGLSAYISGILTVSYDISPWLGMAAAVCLTGLVALLIGIPTLKLRGHYLVMATLGFNLIVNIVMIQWDNVTGGPSGLPGIPNLAIGSWAFDSDRKMYYLIWIVAFFSIVLALNLVNSRVGRGLRALHGSETAAAAVGVRTERYKLNVFVISGLYASLAGSLYAHYLTFISPKTFDIFFSVELVTMVIVGGMGSIWGALFGTMFLTPLPNVLNFVDEYKDICYGLILVSILIFLPEGLLVAARNRWFSPKVSIPEKKIEERYGSMPSQVIGPFRGLVESIPLPANSINPSNSNPILSVRHISMGFGGLVALSEVSFDLPEGSITALIGPNGAGKTTLINVVAGIYEPRRGTIQFGNIEVAGKRPYEMASMGLTRTFQNIQVFENMSVLENVMVGLHATSKNGFIRSMFHLHGFRQEEREIEQRAWEVLSFFGLENKATWPASSLSFGEQKRIEMARALAPNPRLLLLDEPVAGLNMAETVEVAALIRQIRIQGVSVLLVEHDMNLVMGISDKVVVLNYGSKIAEGRPQEIQKDRQVLAAYLGAVA